MSRSRCPSQTLSGNSISPKHTDGNTAWSWRWWLHASLLSEWNGTVKKPLRQKCLQLTRVSTVRGMVGHGTTLRPEGLSFFVVLQGPKWLVVRISQFQFAFCAQSPPTQRVQGDYFLEGKEAGPGTWSLNPHLVPRLRMIGTVHPLPFMWLHGVDRENFTCTFKKRLLVT
jgi:hypothetical protein